MDAMAAFFGQCFGYFPARSNADELKPLRKRDDEIDEQIEFITQFFKNLNKLGLERFTELIHKIKNHDPIEPDWSPWLTSQSEDDIVRIEDFLEQLNKHVPEIVCADLQKDVYVVGTILDAHGESPYQVVAGRDGIYLRNLIDSSYSKRLMSHGQVQRHGNLNLAWLDLTKENLVNMDFIDCNFEKANLSEAVLEKSDLTNANLHKTNLHKAILIKANLSGADLTDANLKGANLYRANFSDAKLKGADFQHAIIRNANFRGVDLRAQQFSENNCLGADFSAANLSGSNFSNAYCGKAKFCDANLSGAKFENSKLSDADLSRANLSGARLINVSLFGANFDGAILDGCSISLNLSCGWDIRTLEIEINHPEFGNLLTMIGSIDNKYAEIKKSLVKQVIDSFSEDNIKYVRQAIVDKLKKNPIYETDPIIARFMDGA